MSAEKGWAHGKLLWEEFYVIKKISHYKNEEQGMLFVWETEEYLPILVHNILTKMHYDTTCFVFQRNFMRQIFIIQSENEEKCNAKKNHIVHIIADTRGMLINIHYSFKDLMKLFIYVNKIQ